MSLYCVCIQGFSKLENNTNKSSPYINKPKKITVIWISLVNFSAKNI